MRNLPLLILLLLVVSPAPGQAEELAISTAALHQFDGGPPLPDSFEFFPGDLLFLSYRISGFKTAEIDDEERYQLFYTITATDPEGIALAETEEGALAGEITPEDKKEKWMPLVRWETQLPMAAPTGDYTVTIGVEDRLGKAKAERQVKFKLRGREVEPSDTLAVRNFNFYRTETSMQPLRSPDYKPGDSVWARFDITGYQFGDGNKFSIDYGIKVLRASGKTLFEQPVAAEEERESFYPERHIQGGLSLNLTKDLTPGEYTVIVTVRDKLGEQTCEESRVINVQ